MKVLNKSLAFLNFIGLCCTKRLREPTNEFMRYNVVSYFFIASIVPMLFGSIYYIYENLTDFSKSTNSLIIFMGAVQGIAVFNSFGSNMKNIKHLYGDIQTMVDKGKFHTFEQ